MMYQPVTCKQFHT